ncbi:MAG: SCO family protein, partial [Bacteroidetes bacterium]|nr:SCO family protein [Bacteroidota bacterium]
MKDIITAGLVLLGTALFSCHRQTVSVRPSCCEKEVAGGTSVAPALSANASVYQLPGIWIDQRGRKISLGDLKGEVRIVAMVFTHCGYACPRLVQDMKAIEDSLPVAERKDVGYVLVSFDTERDDPAQLADYAASQGLGER